MKLRPFDLSMIEDTAMYDKLPYQRDAERCNIGSVALCSGNVVKYYRCNYGDVLELTDMDELAIKKIQQYIEREQERLHVDETDSEVLDDYKDEYIDENELTDDEIAALLADKAKRAAFVDDEDN